MNKHSTHIQRYMGDDTQYALFTHLVVCTCGHQSLAPNEEMAEIHAAAHDHVHYLEARRAPLQS
jgi:hypothetical protein